MLKMHWLLIAPDSAIFIPDPFQRSHCAQTTETQNTFFLAHNFFSFIHIYVCYNMITFIQYMRSQGGRREMMPSQGSFHFCASIFTTTADISDGWMDRWVDRWIDAIHPNIEVRNGEKRGGSDVWGRYLSILCVLSIYHLYPNGGLLKENQSQFAISPPFSFSFISVFLQRQRN